jgi:Zn-dependent protease
MALVPITCPDCSLTKDVPEERIPQGSINVTCPRCHNQFVYANKVIAPQPLPTQPTVAPSPYVKEAVAIAGSESSPKCLQENGEGIFYKLVSHRVSLREFWWGCNGNPLTFLIALVVKLLRINIPGSTDDPNVESMQPFEIPPSQIPADIRTQMQPLLAELQSMGFHSPVFHFIRDGLHNTKTCLVTGASRDGNTLGRVHLRIWSQPHPAKIYVFPEFITALTDGAFLWSLASKPDMTAPDCCTINRAQNASPRELWALHQNALAAMPLTIVQRVGSIEESRAVIARHHVVVRDFHLQRGVFKAMSAEELLNTKETSEKFAAGEAQGREHVEVLEEIDRLQQPKQGWGSAIWIFVISMALFAGTGSATWSWEYMVMVMFVLMFHELGHFVAMKAFNYSNLRIFFIPFFGAAVSGHNYNVPVWKKVVVSLMGPFPGIILGIVLGVAGIRMQNSLLLQAATLTIFLNGLNLLPVLPLDGGWVIHNLFFSRHYLFDTGFRLFAALALIAIGVQIADKFLMILGLFLLITLVHSYRNARIAYNLRKSGFQAVSADNQSIPVELAETIISEVKKAFPKRVNNKTIAQFTLNIFETLNSRPPHWLAVLGLAGVHAGCFIIAVLFTFFFVGFKIAP